MPASSVMPLVLLHGPSNTATCIGTSAFCVLWMMISTGYSVVALIDSHDWKPLKSSSVVDCDIVVEDGGGDIVAVVAVTSLHATLLYLPTMEDDDDDGIVNNRPVVLAAIFTLQGHIGSDANSPLLTIAPLSRPPLTGSSLSPPPSPSSSTSVTASLPGWSSRHPLALDDRSHLVATRPPTIAPTASTTSTMDISTHRLRLRDRADPQ
mmetsp:Transcript_17882/g.50703  ORF Transcript_17882/g.50703 Transcript_17882/m.50703 type:complete len:208 (-) Transcript_17882:1347-1970(-)